MTEIPCKWFATWRLHNYISCEIYQADKGEPDTSKLQNDLDSLRAEVHQKKKDFNEVQAKKEQLQEQCEKLRRDIIKMERAQQQVYFPLFVINKNTIVCINGKLDP